VKVHAKFMIAATHPRQFPAPGPPEVAFLGRSNVGKSSVINSLLGTKLAKTSSTPGRTRSINFFEIRWPGRPKPELVFTDLPGYGYAKVPREVSAEWAGFIEPYLRDRPNLVLSVVLIDPNVPPQPSDEQLCEFLRATQKPFVTVATKADRLSSNQLSHSLERLAAALQPDRMLVFSARTGQGKSDLWQEVRRAAGATADEIEQPQ
jgi:GTP-binding protein